MGWWGERDQDQIKKSKRAYRSSKERARIEIQNQARFRWNKAKTQKEQRVIRRREKARRLAHKVQYELAKRRNTYTEYIREGTVGGRLNTNSGIEVTGKKEGELIKRWQETKKIKTWQQII